MTIERRLAKLEANRGDKAHPDSDAAFAWLAAYLDTGGRDALAAAARCHAKAAKPPSSRM